MSDKHLHLRSLFYTSLPTETHDLFTSCSSFYALLQINQLYATVWILNNQNFSRVFRPVVICLATGTQAPLASWIDRGDILEQLERVC